ncbi:MAG: S9 family peptidase [Prevotella sp.]|nr:S9 family peptidase [Prevotella sp.]
MRKGTLLFAALMLALCVRGGERLTLGGITGGEFAAEGVYGVNAIAGTDLYARISADGKRIVEYSFKTGKETRVLFDVENTQGEQVSRVDGYVMSPDGSRLLIQTATERIYRRSWRAEYYVYNIASRKLDRLSEGGKQQVPTWSPSGNEIAFVRDGNIYLVKLLYDFAESQVTKDGRANSVINGVPDWVYEEEFEYNQAFCFTADGAMICWVRFDESEVGEYSLQLFRGDKPSLDEYALYPGFYSYKYPKAGERNSTVTAWSFDIKSHQTRKLDVPVDADGYLPRIFPTADANRILVASMNRHQDELCLYSVNPRSTLSQLLVKEQVKKYVKEDVLGQLVVAKDHLLMPSDRDGFMHLYLYSMNGTLERKIGDGDWDVTDVYGFNESTGDVYFQAAAEGARDRQIYVSRKNGKTDRLTQQSGWNSAVFSGDYKYFLNTWSDHENPYVYTIRDERGRVLSTPVDNAALRKKLSGYELGRKEFFSFTTGEGVELFGWMVKPSDFDENKRYPVVMFQYSGPGSQQVVDSWSFGSMGQGGLFDSYLAGRGIIVVCVDGRGTGGRGAEWEKCTYGALGLLEARDQVETALWLGRQKYVDAERIGIWGWSYGGFCTLMSMSEGRPVFRAGVAVAAPTSYRYYDTVYTERYMRTPKENPSGYGDNPISRAEKLHGSLLLCHGVADDNVHPQNVFEYTEALVQADKDFKMNLYTNRNHSIYGGNTRKHLLRQIAQFFEDELL